MATRVDYRRMKPIWYFVGAILVGMGAIINLSGLYDLVRKAGSEKVLGYLHANIWWGELMVVVGALFILLSRRPAARTSAPRPQRRRKGHA
jgi:hypothetical protein